MITSGIISFVGVTCGGYLAFSKRLAASTSWKATVTPLASIIRRDRAGFGFAGLALLCLAVFLVGVPTG